MSREGPPGTGPGHLASQHNARCPVNQMKRNPNQPRITKSENVSSRVRGLRHQEAILRRLEGPLGKVFWSIVQLRGRIETELSRLTSDSGCHAATTGEVP
jgi:hypothetical protein